MNNFYIYVDRDGKMPQLRNKKWKAKSHPYYVRYANNNPVAYHGPLDVVATHVTTGGLKFWDYSINEFVPTDGVVAE